MPTVATKSKSYTPKHALNHALAYFEGDELAARVWTEKYALKDLNGNVLELTPADMHRRLAKEYARIEAKYPNALSEESIFDLIDHFKWVVPQGSPMAGIGNSYQLSSLSNCFVIGAEGTGDSYGAILQMDHEQVQLMKRRGGVGHDLSKLRPKGSPVNNSARSSTGLVPFMERFSNTTREVAQDGRRGALMLSLSIEHPDAEEFILAKADTTKITGANVSIKATDAFMNAVVQGDAFTQQFPIGVENPLIKVQTNAQTLWKKIVHQAWSTAEPGLLFWDTILRESLPDCYAAQGFATTSTNPCGEIPLCPYDSCRLLAVNLLSFVEFPFSSQAHFNFEKFEEVVFQAQRLADDQIDLELEKIDAILQKVASDPEAENIRRTEEELWKKIREKAVAGRRTGTGITALGDTLAALGMQYGSKESLAFADELFFQFARAAYTSSEQMARERGAFPIYQATAEEHNPYLKRLALRDPDLVNRIHKNGRRNIALLTIAPTGSTSLLTQTTSGIEPAFTLSYRRRRKVNPGEVAHVAFVDELGDSWEEFNVMHKSFEVWLQQQGVDSPKTLSPEELGAFQQKSPYAGSTAQDVDWLSKVELQGIAQKWIDHSISVTVNVPANATEELIHQLYLKAWKIGCKGITVYREGSRSGVLLTSAAAEPTSVVAKERPKKLHASVMHFNNADEKWLAVVGLLDQRPYEVFTGRAEDAFSLPSYVKQGWVLRSKAEDGRSRYDFQYTDQSGYKVTIEGLSRSFNPEYWNYAKLISGVLRMGMPLADVVALVKHLNLNDSSLNTWKSGVVRALKQFVPNGEKAVGEICENCNQPALSYQEGCMVCTNCGHAHCG